MQFFPFMSSGAAIGAKQFTAAKAGVGQDAKAAAGAVSARFGSAHDAARERFAKLLDGELAPTPEDASGHKKVVLSMWNKAHGGLNAFAKDGVLEMDATLAGARKASVKSKIAKTAKDAKSAQGAQGGTFNLRALLARSGSGPASGVKELSELKMTREDLLALQDGLRAYGLSRADVAALDERIAGEGGLSWGQFMATLSDKMVTMGREFSPVVLSEAENRDMQCLLQKIGFTPAQSDKLLSKLRSGGTASAWDSISAKLTELPSDSNITLDRSELETLGKVVKLSESGQARLTALLSGADSAVITPKQMSTVMTVLRAEVAADKAVDTDSNQALRELVGKALTAASERADLSRQADNKPDNSVRNQKVLAEESRREQTREDAPKGEVEAEKGHAERILEADPNRPALRRAFAEGKGAAAEAGEDGQGGKNSGKGGYEKGEGGESGRYMDRGLNRHGGAQGETASDGKSAQSESEAAWKEMWGKVRVEGHRSASAEETRQAEVRLAAVPGPSERASLQASTRLEPELAARALRQVESGILKNMGQGRTQLVLRLDPPDLGKLNMVLSVKDGEVSAVFRAETSDAQRVISEQLSQLKQHLEQQGIRVGKMEVQTQLQGEQNGNQWHGAGSHNQAQERENFARRGGLLRLLRGDAPDVAQEMQNESAAARIAREGLDIIA